MKIATLESILEARKIAQKFVLKTHLDYSPGASQRFGSDVYFKFENRQRAGSFKIRGASNKLSNLTESEKKRGVIAYSAGNHAQAVAFMAQQLGIDAVIVMPMASPLVKVAATKSYGAEVHLVGTSMEESYEYMLGLQKKHNYVLVHPYEDPYIISGQGTLGLEISEECPQADLVVIPIGGGGLISGSAIALKSHNPKIHIVGVQTQAASGMAEMFATKGKVPKNLSHVATIADGIAIKKPSKIMYDNYISQWVDEVVTVSEDEIAEAILFLMEKEKTVVEGAGASSTAALFSGRIKKKSKKAVVVLSGGNVDSNLIEKVVDRGLAKSGRLVLLRVIVPDVPGSLTKLTSVIAEQRANVMQINHVRVHEELKLGEVLIEFTLETTGFDHIKNLQKSLSSVGGRFVP